MGDSADAPQATAAANTSCLRRKPDMETPEQLNFILT
jgi:hypothetical protein